jgi:DNA-binding transcriptional ArsR family regulator
MPTPAKRDLTAALKALAHPSRLAAVRALEKGELCVCQLQEVMGSDLSTVSRHVKLLTHAGLIASRREGKWIYCRLAAPCALEFLDCLEAALNGKPCAAPAPKRRAKK